MRYISVVNVLVLGSDKRHNSCSCSGGVQFIYIILSYISLSDFLVEMIGSSSRISRSSLIAALTMLMRMPCINIIIVVLISSFPKRICNPPPHTLFVTKRTKLKHQSAYFNWESCDKWGSEYVEII